MRYEKSSALLARAKEIIPAAAQTYSKNYRCYCEGAAPAFLEKGEGAYVVDVDSNRYIDFVLGLGPVTIGYNDPKINRAVIEQLKKGISFTQPHPLEVALAEKIVEIVPCAEMVKFVKNGSDATAAAVRLARAATGRDLVLCCGYHGFHDWYVGSTVNNRGVPAAVSNLTLRFPYNDPDTLKKLFQENSGKIAGVIMEPVALEPPQDGFLSEVRKICSQNGAVLIFDEVITGFRVAPGGAQEYYGVTPDLCTMGKGIANGMPLSLLAGKKEIMALIDQGAFVSTTFGGETLSLAAALETIRLMESRNYFDHVWHLGTMWLENAARLIEEKDLGEVVKTTGLPPHSGVVFKQCGDVTAEDFKSLFIQEIISEGILSLGINNYCLSHTEADVQKYIAALENVFSAFREAIEKNTVAHLLKGGKFFPVFARN